MSSKVTLVNTILAKQGLAVRATKGNTVTLQATLWDSNQVNYQVGAGTIATGTADLNFFGSAQFKADGYHIQNNSKAVGVGVPTVVSQDIDGDGRPQGNGPELGADELVANCAAVASNDLSVTYSSVQAAIDAADPGKEVRIAGTCSGALTRSGLAQLAYVNKNITVRGGYTPTNWLVSYPITQPTFLDAKGAGRVFFIVSGFNPTIENLNMSGGDAKNQGGGPGGLDAGGIVYANGASPTIHNSTFTGGNAYYGGALYLQNGAGSITGNTMTGNNGTKGGAVFLRNSTATLQGNKALNNLADDGAGMFLSFSQPLLDGNQVAQNNAASAGGGLFLESSAATLRSNSVTTNTAQAAGGIYLDSSNAALLRNTIMSNSGQNGGGVYLSSSDATLDGNRVLKNSAGIGGGVYLQAGKPKLFNNVIALNQGLVQASAIYILSSSPSVRENTIAGNSGGDGSGIYVTDLGVQPAAIDLIDNILVDHTAAITVTAGNKVTLQANLLHGNKIDFGGSGIVVKGTGNINADPGFVDAGANDYHLRSDSPARDAGIDAGVTTDMDNQRRPADAGFDIGADEVVLIGLHLIIQTAPDPIVVNSPFSLIIRAINQGNVDLNAIITVTLPAQIKFDNIPPPINGGTVYTFTASIPRGQTWTKTLMAQVQNDFVGTLEIKAQAASDQGATDQVTATATAQRQDKAFELTAQLSPNPPPAGSPLNYQIRVANLGNVAITPTVYAQLPPQVSPTGLFTFTPAALGPGGSWSKSLKTTLKPKTTGSIIALFRATAPGVPTTQYTLTTAVAMPGLAVSRAVEPAPAIAGQLITYTVIVTNTGNVSYTVTITDHMPVDAQGMPLVAPGADQIWSGIEVAAGATYKRILTATVQAGYTGPLGSSAEVTAAPAGIPPLHAAYSDTLSSKLATLGPTIVAVQSGPWNDPNTWKPKRVPNASDIAQVGASITLTVDGSQVNPIALTGLINRGNILLQCVTGQPITFNISDTLINTGQILGANGQAPGEPGCAVNVNTTTLQNDGLIRAGDGGPGGTGAGGVLLPGGDGGPITAIGKSIANNGQILAGNGGSVIPSNLNADGGAGGSATAFAGPGVPGMLVNRGVIAAGKGGNGGGDGNGGNGGDVALLSTSLLLVDGGAQQSGLGGLGNPPGKGRDGSGGASSSGAATTWQNGHVQQNDQDYAFVTLTPGAQSGAAGTTIQAPIFFLNLGLHADRYNLIWSNSSGWAIGNLPTTLDVGSLQFANLTVDVALPANLHSGDTTILRFTARSQGKPTLAVDRSIRLLITAGAGIGPLYLPTVVDGALTAPELPPSQWPVKLYMPVIEKND